MRALYLRVSIVRACPAPSCTCPAHTCAQALFVRRCHASFVCIDLSPRLPAYGLLGGCTQAPLHISQPLGPTMGLRRRHLHFCVAWPTQVDFVFSVTLYMHRQDLEPILPITQYSCMQLFSATHSHPLHGISANLEKLFPKYSSQSFADTREGVCIIHNPCALPIIASVSPKPIPCLFACFYESVSYVYVLFSTCLSNCVASAAWVVFGFVFISTFLFSCFFSCDYSTYLWHGVLLYA